LQELRTALDGYDRAIAAEISGVREQDLDDLLAAIRRHGRVATETGTGIGMSAGANLTAWFCWLIMILTGSTNERGGAWFHPGFFRPREVFEPPVPPTPFWPASKTRTDVMSIIGPGGGPDWPCAVLPPEIEAGNIRAFFNFGGNVIRSFPAANALLAALPKLELHVATEIIHNELTPLATHILLTKDAIERPEYSRWSDAFAWNVSMQYSAPLVAPMGERRSAWWVLSQCMRRADLPVPEYVPDDDRVDGADEVMLARQFKRHARCGFEELKEKRYVEFPLEFPADWVERHFERIGGWQLAPEELLAQWNEFRAVDETSLGQPKPLVYTSRRQFKKCNSQLGFLGEPANVLLHPDTALERGIADGQKVRVHNERGEVVLVAKVDPTMRKGVASIPHGRLDANVNNLTSCDEMDPLGGMALFSGVPIEIEPAEFSAVANVPRRDDR
jgi:anaerobic selenocysteine-containing dehydrogenase